MSKGEGIILGFAFRGEGEVRLSWDVRREGGIHFLRGGGADLFWNDPFDLKSVQVRLIRTSPQHSTDAE